MQSVAFLKQVFNGVKEKAVGARENSLKGEQISLQIREVLKQIECVEKKFDFETDFDMIDALIYEHHALLSRYKHLIILAKQMNLSVAPTIS